jgi:hypothetical protein
MLATDISANDCLRNWVAGVSNTGTFTKTKDVDIPIATLYNEYNGIPKRWSIKEI